MRSVICLGSVLLLAVGQAVGMTFHLLCWTNASGSLVTAVGRRPAPHGSFSNDWLLFTQDDEVVGAQFNPYGALSHSFEDIHARGAAWADAMPSLSGSFDIGVTPLSPTLATVAWERVDWVAQIEPDHVGHIRLADEHHRGVITNPVYGIDGSPNAGVWYPTTWRFAATVDLFAEHHHHIGNEALDDHQHGVAHAHNDQVCQGWLIPLTEVTANTLASNMPSDVTGFYPGSFAAYVTSEILPRIPTGATHVIILQSPKNRVTYSVEGMTTNSLYGLTLISYSYDEIPEPAVLLALAWAGLVGRRGWRGHTASRL